MDEEQFTKIIELRFRSRLILSSAEFVRGFVPPDYVVDGILQRRFIYSLTGKTNSGKTATLLLLSAHVALVGRPIGDRGVEQGRVLYFAGENPTDARMRWIAMAREMDFDRNTIDVHFIDGAFRISEMREQIETEIKQIGDFSLIVVDTSAAFFEGDNENDNKQQGQHARRLRGLTELPGGPCVVVACHPPKNAGDDNLQPRGGGSFIAEIDGNLTARKDESAIEVHWQGKFRGPDFAPLTFQLRTVTHPDLKDSKGRLLPTVVASHLTETAREAASEAARSSEDELLKLLAQPGNARATQRQLAEQLGWRMQDGQPYQVRVRRALDALLAAKLITISRGRTKLTPAGKEALRPTGPPKEKQAKRATRPADDPAVPVGSKVFGAAPGRKCELCGSGRDVHLIQLPGEHEPAPRHQQCAWRYWEKKSSTKKGPL